jgi:DNA-binding GntR family transcriptional regulator
MSRSNSVYKETYNRCLHRLAQLEPQMQLPPETELASALNASRTTVRAVLTQLNDRGLIHWDGRTKTLLRAPKRGDYFAIEETRSASQKVEEQFMDLILGGNLAPGSILRESELARDFGVSSSAIREYLIRFSRFGLIEKEPNRHWVLRGFTRDFAEELFDVREGFEQKAFRNFTAHPLSSIESKQLAALHVAHVVMHKNIDTDYLRFSRLDERFHRLFINALDNRFIDDFYELISMIFHFHYRWRKTDEKERNRTALEEHLAILRALEKGDVETATRHFNAHLQSARRTLLASVIWETVDPAPR